jgi:hypothetical protein
MISTACNLETGAEAALAAVGGSDDVLWARLSEHPTVNPKESKHQPTLLAPE